MSAPRLAHALVAGYLVVGAAGACDSSEAYLVVSVTARPAVHDATHLRVTLGNAGTMRTDVLALDGAAFPVTFSVEAPGRTGDLQVSVEAIDASELRVGAGTTTTALGEDTATLRLDSTDFVVNTDIAEDQAPSNDFEAHGAQVSATGDGTWTAVYTDRCTSPCNMLARRFDPAGRAVTTRIAANTNAFPVSTNLTTQASTPAVASAATATIALWDYDEPTGTALGVACRGLDTAGMATAAEALIATDPSTDVVAVTPLANSNFAVAWSAFITTRVVRSAIVRPDCTLLPSSAPITVSTTASATRPAVAASGQPSTVMYAWITDGAVRVRLGSATNTLTGAADTAFLPATATEQVDAVRVAPLPSGFAVVVRWTLAAASEGPGRLELYRTNLTGAVMGAPIVVSTRSGTDFASSEGFGVATGADGTLMVVWHACLAAGDGSGCGVFGRAFAPDGTPLGEEFSVATTTAGDQTGPSVTALPDGAFAAVWKDASTAAPDVSGSAVRARVLYTR